MNAKTIGDKLKAMRNDLGISAFEAAKGIGITERALRAYEYGDRIPRDEAKIQIAKFYKTNVESIFFDN